MSYLELLILEALAEQPRHGYEIKRTVSRALAGSVSLNNNVLYPALKRFERSGAVEKTVEPHEGRPARHVYRLTETGRAHFEAMLRDFPPEAAQQDTEFLIRVAFFERLEPKARLQILHARSEALRLRLQQLELLRPDAAEASSWSLRVLDFVRRAVIAELAWIEELERAPAQRKRPRRR
jgi:DNA-binding PadR family transcriptional regulator